MAGIAAAAGLVSAVLAGVEVVGTDAAGATDGFAEGAETGDGVEVVAVGAGVAATGRTTGGGGGACSHGRSATGAGLATGVAAAGATTPCGATTGCDTATGLGASVMAGAVAAGACDGAAG